MAPPFASVWFDCDSTLTAIEGVDELLQDASAELRADIASLTERAMNGVLPLAGVYESRLRLLAPPGSLLLEHRETAASFGRLDPALLTHVWRHPDPEMDRLQVDVAELAEEAAATGARPYETFDRIYARAGLEPAARPIPRPTPPRLTEPWFC